MLVGRHGEHAKRLPAEPSLVLFCCMRGKVAAHLPFQAGLPDIVPGGWHGAAINLDDKAPTRPVGKQQAKHKIRDDADFVDDSTMRDLDVKRKRVALGKTLIRE